MQMVDRMYCKMLSVLQDISTVAALTTWGLAIYSDISFLSFSCLKHKKIRSMNARSAIMHYTNMKIMLESASSSNHESMSSSLFVFSKLSLKNALSCPILSDFDKYIMFCLRSPMIVSYCLSEIGGTLFSLNTPDRFVLITLKAGILAELGKHKICSFSL